MKIKQKFFTACAEGRLHEVKEVIKTGKINIDERSPEGWTGLIISCFNAHKEIVEFLIDHKADVNATNAKGTSVFMYAKTPVQKNPRKTEILELLLDNGAEINHLDSFNKTVLDYVMENGAPELGNWLISNGAKHAKDLFKN